MCAQALRPRSNRLGPPSAATVGQSGAAGARRVTARMSIAPKVCVVGDDAAVLPALGRLLPSVGYTVETFPESEAFLTMVLSPPPDCLVVDIQLGASSGFA